MYESKIIKQTLSCNSHHIIYERNSWTISQMNISVLIDVTISGFKMPYVQRIAPFWFNKYFAMQMYIKYSCLRIDLS